MKVPFLDLKSQFKSIQMDVRPAIEEVLESTQFILNQQQHIFSKVNTELFYEEVAIVYRGEQWLGGGYG